MNCLLRTYATNIQIEQALSMARDLRQKPGEVENEYATRMMTALAQCRDIHSPYERTTFSIEGLLPAIKPLVLQAREDRPGPRSRTRSRKLAHTGRPTARKRPVLGDASTSRRPPLSGVLAIAESLPSSLSAGLTPSYHTGLDDENFLAHEDPYATAGSPSFPTEESSFNDGDSLFYGERRPASKNQPWLRRPRETTPGFAGRGGPREMKKPSPQIICYTCYKVGDHISPDCSMKVRDVSLVPHNFEKLTAAQKARIPADAYLRAVALLRFEANRLIAPVLQSKSPSDSERPSPLSAKTALPKT